MICTCPDLTAILAEARGLRAELDRFKRKHNDFAARIANEIGELFTKVDARVKGLTIPLSIEELIAAVCKRRIVWR
jgi:hypothetical protein